MLHNCGVIFRFVYFYPAIFTENHDRGQKWRQQEAETASRIGDGNSDPVPSQLNAHAAVINFYGRQLFSTEEAIVSTEGQYF